ncbi:Fe-S cluster assembly sulfur transfer protein SufU [Ruania halotolerans]|uniref:Fe-S cluster assembly sulfur transfer protein SufU n=1 Tax=Ruania halotolerans TaxID=2897773 RepID=UPI001E60EBDC|nr:SUF system NifU family Fe-S cluster assembly protein [Ruania halotolerans]UFU05041.1 SUF system NifU family Fe-S cluster assembly protein [Ruania halotolerans]
MTGSMAQLYQQVILDHSRERHGAGPGPDAAAESFQVNPTCGDEVRLRVHLAADAATPTVDHVTWDGAGCSISQASVSVLSDLVVGADVAQIDHLTETFRDLMNNRGEPLDEKSEEVLGDGAAFVGVARYPARIKCALLGWMALRDALAQAVTSPPRAG